MIIALSGPSGIGKGYIKETLKETYPDIKELVWYTTRTLRPNELNNSNRKHISEEELKDMVDAGEMALVQGMFGHRYAVKKQDLLQEDGVILTEVHPYVIKEAKMINPKLISVGLVTDDFELLRERLSNRRKTESPDEIDRRIREAEDEVSAIRRNLQFYDTLIEITSKNETQIAEIARNMFAEYKKEGDKYVADEGRKCRA